MRYLLLQVKQQQLDGSPELSFPQPHSCRSAWRAMALSPTLAPGTMFRLSVNKTKTKTQTYCGPGLK